MLMGLLFCGIFLLQDGVFAKRGIIGQDFYGAADDIFVFSHLLTIFRVMQIRSLALSNYAVALFS